MKTFRVQVRNVAVNVSRFTVVILRSACVCNGVCASECSQSSQKLFIKCSPCYLLLIQWKVSLKAKRRFNRTVCFYEYEICSL